jgi:hypothetical protein
MRKPLMLILLGCLCLTLSACGSKAMTKKAAPKPAPAEKSNN